MNALDVLCAQLTRDLFAIAKYLYSVIPKLRCYDLLWICCRIHSI